MDKFTLYTYFRSSAAYRVRIALNYKGIAYSAKYVHLTKDSGQQHSTSYKKINPQALVPSLVIKDSNAVISQSLAIIEYLEDIAPEKPLLPTKPLRRAQIRAFSQTVCCDIHPLNNLRVLKYIEGPLSITDKQKAAWYQHWVSAGFTALETQLKNNNSVDFCFDERISLADICLIPQVYNAIRFQCNLDDFPFINRIYHHCLTLKAFKQASPESQADYE